MSYIDTNTLEVTCDQCGRRKVVSKTGRRVNMPVGWGSREYPPVEVCSRECATFWAKDHAADLFEWQEADPEQAQRDIDRLTDAFRPGVQALVDAAAKSA